MERFCSRYIDEAIKRAAVLSELGEDERSPCTREEVQGLEQWLGYRLPEAYREFLFWMGHSGGGVLVGSHCFYADLRDIQSYARILLDEDHFPGHLPEDAFVFFMHQGYTFAFFRRGEGDDPPIYHYREDIPLQTSFSHSLKFKFSDFVLRAVNLRIEAIEALKAMEASQLRWKELRKQRLQKILEKRRIDAGEEHKNGLG